MKRKIFIYPLLLLFACNSETKILDFGQFTIEVPKTWNKIQNNGIDSYVGQISLDNNDTISFDLGWYSNDLSEQGETKNIVSYDRIDDRNAKIVTPEQAGNGITGIFIDSIWVRGSGIDRFQMNGHNLKILNQKEFLKAIHTIKFKK